jgi:hypothetical protein
MNIFIFETANLIPTIYIKGGAETDVFIATRKWKGDE